MSKIDPKLVSEIAYIVEHFNDSSLTEMKLEKLLYYAEAAFYAKDGKTISDCRYYNNDHGPTPSFSYYKDAKEYLITNGYIKEINGKHKKFHTIKTFENNKLTTLEVSILESTCHEWEGKTASQMRKATHLDAPFLASDYKKEINFRSVYQRFDEKELKPLSF